VFKCAIIGVSGSRAHGHAEAYQHIRRGRLVAISSRQAEKLDEFGDRFHIQARYTDYGEMFEKERPDLVHVNTPPDVRLEIIQAAAAAGIPALLMEKPLAIQGEDYLALRDFAAGASTKIAVNHQLHFHPRRRALQAFVQDGKIGEVRFIEASAGMNLAYQGTHSLQAIGAFHPDGVPVSVFGQASGAEGLRPTSKQHFAPDQCLAGINFADGLSALLRCGSNAPRVGPGGIHTHKRVAVFGTRGYVHWTMWSWETSSDGHRESGVHQYGEEDILGQAAMTEAMFDWLDDDRAVHPLHLDRALLDFNIILGIYMSALNHAPIALPVQPERNLIARLRRQLEAGAD
jgi:predicted dehydrogenase